MGTAMRTTMVRLTTLASLSAAAAAAGELSSDAFLIRYDSSGIRSLKWVNDVHDIDYIAANGALGRLVVRYRTTANGDWRELRDVIQRPVEGSTQAIGYTLAARLPSLAAKSSASAVTGAGGLRTLN